MQHGLQRHGAVSWLGTRRYDGRDARDSEAGVALDRVAVGTDCPHSKERQGLSPFSLTEVLALTYFSSNPILTDHLAPFAGAQALQLLTECQLVNEGRGQRCQGRVLHPVQKGCPRSDEGSSNCWSKKTQCLETGWSN